MGARSLPVAGKEGTPVVVVTIDVGVGDGNVPDWLDVWPISKLGVDGGTDVDEDSTTGEVAGADEGIATDVVVVDANDASVATGVDGVGGVEVDGVLASVVVVVVVTMIGSGPHMATGQLPGWHM